MGCCSGRPAQADPAAARRPTRGRSEVAALAEELRTTEAAVGNALPADGGVGQDSSGIPCAFAPVLVATGGGAILNVLSALSWFSSDGVNAYAAAKAAEWSLTNGIRLELAAQGTQVTGVHVSAVYTDIMAGYDGPKVNPAEVVRAALDGSEAGPFEVVVDEWSATIKATLAKDPADFYQPASAVTHAT